MPEITYVHKTRPNERITLLSDGEPEYGAFGGYPVGSFYYIRLSANDWKRDVVSYEEGSVAKAPGTYPMVFSEGSWHQILIKPGRGFESRPAEPWEVEDIYNGELQVIQSTKKEDLNG